MAVFVTLSPTGCCSSSDSDLQKICGWRLAAGHRFWHEVLRIGQICDRIPSTHGSLLKEIQCQKKRLFGTGDRVSIRDV